VRAAGAAPPPLAELSTLPWVCRKSAPGTVRVSARAKRLRAACLPGADTALALTRELFPQSDPERDVLATGLANTNLVLHPPGAILGAAWVEATGGDFRFYADGTTPGVARVMRALDGERLEVARALGHDLPPLAEEMALIGTADPEAARAGDLRRAVADGEANAGIMAPDSLAHRYYREDFAYGLVPFVELAAIAGVPVPAAGSLLRIGELLTGETFQESGLTAERLGIAGMGLDGLLEQVRRRPAPQVGGR
jgi:opine dehydrogenase